jgi:hypothetical protein
MPAHGAIIKTRCARGDPEPFHRVSQAVQAGPAEFEAQTTVSSSLPRWLLVVRWLLVAPGGRWMCMFEVRRAYIACTIESFLLRKIKY